MDTDQLIAHGRARFEHAAARRLLKEKYQAKMLFAHAGGMWRAGPDLLAVLATCRDSRAVLLDCYDVPVQVTVEELSGMAYQRWQEQMTAWMMDHQALQDRR